MEKIEFCKGGKSSQGGSVMTSSFVKKADVKKKTTPPKTNYALADLFEDYTNFLSHLTLNSLPWHYKRKVSQK